MTSSSLPLIVLSLGTNCNTPKAEASFILLPTVDISAPQILIMPSCFFFVYKFFIF